MPAAKKDSSQPQPPRMPSAGKWMQASPSASSAEQDRQPEQPQHAQRQHHQIHHEFVAQRPQRAVDLEPDRIVDEHHAAAARAREDREACSGTRSDRARAGANNRRAASVVTSGASTKADRTSATMRPGKMRRQRFGEIAQRRAGLLEALRDQKAADGEEHEHAGEAEHRLIAGQRRSAARGAACPRR